MAETWNKKEREKKKQQSRKEKEERKQERKETAKSKNPDDMLAYIDENGNISSTPPDPKKMRKVRLESVFVHINGLKEAIKENNKVTFEVEMTQKGASAINVKMAN